MEVGLLREEGKETGREHSHANPTEIDFPGLGSCPSKDEQDDGDYQQKGAHVAHVGRIPESVRVETTSLID